MALASSGTRFVTFATFVHGAKRIELEKPESWKIGNSDFRMTSQPPLLKPDLWFRGRSERRSQSEAYVRQVVQSLGGEILSQCVIPEIRYHAILGTIPRAGIQQMVSQPQFINEIELLRCDDVMHIRPVGQCAITIPEDGLGLGTLDTTQLQDMPTKEPLVALLDGMPLTAHQLIAERLIVDDPDDYEREYLAHERVHGTAMSSLVCFGRRE